MSLAEKPILEWEIDAADIISVNNISPPSKTTKCRWKYSFELDWNQYGKGKQTFKLFAPTTEERDLWIESLHIYLNVKVSPTLCGGVKKGGRDITELYKIKRSYVDKFDVTKSGYRLVNKFQQEAALELDKKKDPSSDKKKQDEQQRKEKEH